MIDITNENGKNGDYSGAGDLYIAAKWIMASCVEAKSDHVGGLLGDLGEQCPLYSFYESAYSLSPYRRAQKSLRRRQILLAQSALYRPEDRIPNCPTIPDRRHPDLESADHVWSSFNQPFNIDSLQNHSLLR